MGKFASIEGMKIEDYDEVMNVNLRSAIILTQLCLPHLISTKGINFMPDYNYNERSC